MKGRNHTLTRRSSIPQILYKDRENPKFNISLKQTELIDKKNGLMLRWQ